MSKELFESVRKLNLPKGEYAIFGSGPLGIRGIRESRDIDIIVTESLFENLKQGPNWTYEEFERDGRIIPHLLKERTEIYKSWAPGKWDVGKLIKESETIDGLPFVRLEEVLRWKKLSARDKDLEDAGLIQDYLSERQK